MRDTSGNAGNDISGYDTEFHISPGLDNSNCYSAALGYNSGRYTNSCTIPDSAGPYSGTPAGQPVPWTLITGAIGYAIGSGIPAVFNCYQICPGPPLWVGE